MMRHTIKRRLFLLAFVLPLSGCGAVLKSDYQMPEVRIPATWQGASGQSAITQEEEAERWWTLFADSRLTALIDRALAENNDLAAAAIRVRRARLSAGLVDTNLTPSVSVGADGGVSRNFDAARNTKSYSANASLNYEIDLWGKLARERDMAVWEAEATEFDRQSVALALIGTTAQLNGFKTVRQAFFTLKAPVRWCARKRRRVRSRRWIWRCPSKAWPARKRRMNRY